MDKEGGEGREKRKVGERNCERKRERTEGRRDNERKKREGQTRVQSLSQKYGVHTVRFL